MARAALVTGVSRGLGLAVARRLLEKEWTVYGISRSESAEWQALAAGAGPRVEWRGCDLADAAALQTLCAEWLGTGRPIHALVNNAGVAYDDLVTNARRAPLEAMFAVNVTAPLMLTRHVLRNMLFHSTRGALAHVSSISVQRGAKGLAMYAATKGALEAFSRNIAREWGARGVRSNCVVPGYMPTEMSSTLSAEQRESIRRRAALQEYTDIESVAATIAFLLSDDARSITGQSIVVDAGYA